MEVTVLDQFIGKVFTSIDKSDDEIIFTESNGDKYHMYHPQDCCENVSIEDVCGDLDDLIGNPILKAEERTSQENPEDIKKEYQDSFTWTFYEFATIKGNVTIRWYGESNGYYSESVYFEKMRSYEEY